MAVAVVVGVEWKNFPNKCRNFCVCVWCAVSAWVWEYFIEVRHTTKWNNREIRLTQLTKPNTNTNTTQRNLYTCFVT